MSDQNDNVYYILLADKTGKEKERGILRPTSKVDVFPGTLLLLVEERNDKQRDILWWTLEALDPENIEIECQPTDTGQLSKTEFALLQPIPVCEERLSIFQDQVWLKEGAQLQINDHVTVAVEGQPYLKGIIKYKGQLPREKGIWFGIELLGESKGYGTCEGVFRDRRLFTCEQKCGIFATIREVRRDHDADRSYQEEQRLIEESGLREKDRVVWISDNGPEFGEVKWIGILPDSNRRDITVGVEFDNPVGTGTGKYRNHRLFYAKEKHASLVPSMGLMKADVYMEMGQGTGTFSNANCLHDYRILLKPDHIKLPIMSQTRSTLPTRTPNYNHVRKEMLPIPHSYEMECNTNSTSLDRNVGNDKVSDDRIFCLRTNCFWVVPILFLMAISLLLFLARL